MEIFLENYEKNGILLIVKDLQSSHQLLIEWKSLNNIKNQLIHHLKNCKYFSLALDESCNIKESA